jgi:hypothetical protein
MPGSIHITNKVEGGKVIPIEGVIRTGASFLHFRGQLPNSPLSISFEVSIHAIMKAECFNFFISFEPKRWFGQPILHLAYFDHVVSLVNAFSGKTAPEMEIFIQGNSALKGNISNEAINIGSEITKSLEWFHQCRWLAKHFKINPILPPVEKIDRKNIKILDEVYSLLKRLGTTVEAENAEFSSLGDKMLSDDQIAHSDKILTMEMPDRKFDFFGIEIKLGMIREVFTDMELVSQIPLDDGRVKVVFRGTKNTKLTSSLI